MWSSSSLTLALLRTCEHFFTGKFTVRENSTPLWTVSGRLCSSTDQETDRLYEWKACNCYWKKGGYIGHWFLNVRNAYLKFLSSFIILTLTGDNKQVRWEHFHFYFSCPQIVLRKPKSHFYFLKYSGLRFINISGLTKSAVVVQQ